MAHPNKDCVAIKRCKIDQNIRISNDKPNFYTMDNAKRCAYKLNVSTLDIDSFVYLWNKQRIKSYTFT